MALIQGLGSNDKLLPIGATAEGEATVVDADVGQTQREALQELSAIRFGLAMILKLKPSELLALPDK